jgi:hypothetical protein
MEKYPTYNSIFAKLSYGESQMLDKAFYEEEVKRLCLAFEQQVDLHMMNKNNEVDKSMHKVGQFNSYLCLQSLLFFEYAVPLCSILCICSITGARDSKSHVDI